MINNFTQKQFCVLLKLSCHVRNEIVGSKVMSILNLKCVAPSRLGRVVAFYAFAGFVYNQLIVTSVL
jgi:hypothetical protein